MARRNHILWAWSPLLAALLASAAEGYIATDRWTTTATNGFVASVGTPGAPVTVTWSFAPDGTIIPGETSGTTVPSGLIGFLDTSFGAGPGGVDYTLRPWFPIFQQSFDRMSAVAGVTYVYEPNDNGVAFTSGNSGRGVLGVRGDVRLSGRTYGSGSSTLASNFFPDYAEMMINTDRGDYFAVASNNYRRFRNTLMHEAMHGLGISHVDSSSSGFLIEPFISTSFDGPQLDDLLAMQRLYGDVREKNGGNDTTTLATPLGTVSPAQSRVMGALGNSTVISSTQTDFLSIDDDGDTDFFSFTIDDPYDVLLAVSPRGVTYQVGPQDGTQSSFNSLTVSNLSLALFAPNGTTVLAAADVAGAGLGESLLRDLDPGTYYARVKGAQNNIQLYQISLSASASGPDTLLWVGSVSNVWDVSAAANFKNSVSADVFRDGDLAVFGAGPSTTNITLQGDVAPGTVLVTSASYSFGGPGRLMEGSVTVDSGATLVLANSGNSYTGPTAVAGTLRITGDANAMASPVTVASGGVLILDATDAGAMASAITIDAGGELQIGASESSANVFPDAPTSVVNNGVIRVFDSELLSHVTGVGPVVVESEVSQFADNPGFSGQVIVRSGAVVEMTATDGLGNELGATVVDGGGTIVVRVGGPLGEYFTLSGDGGGLGALNVAADQSAAFLGRVIVQGAATIRLEENASANFSGEVYGAATGAALTLDIEAGAEADLAAPTLLGGGGLLKVGAGTAKLTGPFSLTGVTEVRAGVLQVGGAMPLDGEFRVGAGGTLRVVERDAFSPFARLAGNGAVVGNVTFPGTIAPGESAGVLSFDGDLSLDDGCLVQIEIGGPTPAIEYDQLHITGTAELDGVVAVELTGGFMPSAGDAFSILTASQLVDEFNSVVLPALDPGLTWDLAYFANEVLLSVGAVPVFDSADFNLDSVVDGEDLAIWQSGYSLEGAAAAQGDADGDSLVDGADFLTWQRQLNAPTPPGEAQQVPEPTALALVLCTVGYVQARANRLRWRAAASAAWA